jgi:hypothetical protein
LLFFFKNAEKTPGNLAIAYAYFQPNEIRVPEKRGFPKENPFHL